MNAIVVPATNSAGIREPCLERPRRPDEPGLLERRRVGEAFEGGRGTPKNALQVRSDQGALFRAEFVACRARKPEQLAARGVGARELRLH